MDYDIFFQTHWIKFMYKILLDLFQICCTLLNKVKNTDHQRIDTFKLWYWRRLLRVPWTSRISNKSNLKEINPEYSFGRTNAEAEAPILWPLDEKSQLIGKGLDAGKD